MVIHYGKKKGTYIKIEQDRINAVTLYLKGKSPSKICKSLSRSRRGLYKWIERYNNAKKNGKRKWFEEDSRAPIKVHRKVNSDIEKLAVNVRKSLVEGGTDETKYRCIGADEIQFRIHELGYLEHDMPSISTIKRIIKRNKLVIQKRKRYVRCKSKKRYTMLNTTKINEVHQMDFIGPRYIKGYGAISSLNTIDVVSNVVYLQQYTSRTMNYVI